MLRHPDFRGKEMSYSDGSEAPKTEGGLPARLFYNDISPPKAEDAGKNLSACTAQADARTTLPIHLLAIRSHPISLSSTLLPRDFRMSDAGFKMPLSRRKRFTSPTFNHTLTEESPCSSNTTNDENVVQASLPASFGGKMPPLPSIFR